MGLALRRHFLAEGRRLTGIEDERFGLLGDGRDGSGGEGDDGEGDELALAGPGALLAALERTRSGRMRDIVATVQREQDEVIRAPLAGVLVVQGGPGTGKTAVALHRAAYLLYTHRFPLERQGVLVIGPNPLFLRYIEHVLPSLGESGVELSTVSGLVPDARVGGRDDREAARVKGDRRMARLLHRAVADRERPLRADLLVGFGPHRLRLSMAASASIVAAVKRRGGAHNARRRQIETLVFRQLHAEYQAAEERIRRVGLRPQLDVDPDDLDDLDDVDDLGQPRPGPDELTEADLARALKREVSVVEALDRMWPVLTPHQLLHDLFGAPPLINLAGRGLFDPADLERLRRPRSPSVDAVPWTDADIALLDEARALLGPRRRRRPQNEDGEPEGLRAFGHIVVDEAQDLSPMQLRMLGRRSLSGSMTIVGDIAQATGNWAPGSWEDVLTELAPRRGSRVTELTVNYRTPAEIMAVASRVLAVAAPDMRPADSVRSTGEQPVVVEAGESGPIGAVAEVVAAQGAGGGGRAGGRGTLAVICPASMVEDLAAGLRAAGIAFGEPNRTGLDADVTLVPVELVKGLEFDSVIVVEPSRLVRESAQGLRALYVALTRATQRMTLVHAEPLPAMLGL
jgi:DNA helicase IV